MKLQNANAQRDFFFKHRNAQHELEREVRNQIIAVLNENDVFSINFRKPFAILRFNGCDYVHDEIIAVSKDVTCIVPNFTITLSSSIDTPISILDADIIADFTELFGEILENIEYGILD